MKMTFNFWNVMNWGMNMATNHFTSRDLDRKFFNLLKFICEFQDDVVLFQEVGEDNSLQKTMDGIMNYTQNKLYNATNWTRHSLNDIKYLKVIKDDNYQITISTDYMGGRQSYKLYETKVTGTEGRQEKYFAFVNTNGELVPSSFEILEEPFYKGAEQYLGTSNHWSTNKSAMLNWLKTNDLAKNKNVNTIHEALNDYRRMGVLEGHHKDNPNHKFLIGVIHTPPSKSKLYFNNVQYPYLLLNYVALWVYGMRKYNGEVSMYLGGDFNFKQENEPHYDNLANYIREVKYTKNSLKIVNPGVFGIGPYTKWLPKSDSNKNNQITSPPRTKTSLRQTGTIGEYRKENTTHFLNYDTIDLQSKLSNLNQDQLDLEQVTTDRAMLNPFDQIVKLVTLNGKNLDYDDGITHLETRCRDFFEGLLELDTNNVPLSRTLIELQRDNVHQLEDSINSILQNTLGLDFNFLSFKTNTTVNETGILKLIDDFLNKNTADKVTMVSFFDSEQDKKNKIKSNFKTDDDKLIAKDENETIVTLSAVFLFRKSSISFSIH
ncbi:MAG: hypothetical protein AAFQ98_15045, partial [Bacteroidota bacterium]